MTDLTAIIKVFHKTADFKNPKIIPIYITFIAQKHYHNVENNVNIIVQITVNKTIPDIYS